MDKVLGNFIEVFDKVKNKELKKSWSVCVFVGKTVLRPLLNRATLISLHHQTIALSALDQNAQSKE